MIIDKELEELMNQMKDLQKRQNEYDETGECEDVDDLIDGTILNVGMMIVNKLENQ